jgi:hypothetical protein
MTDKQDVPRDATVSDTVERIRAERFPDIDRALVLELMSLHAAGTSPENMGRLIDEAIMTQVQGAR